MREILFRGWTGEEMIYQSDNTASAMNGLEHFAQLVGQAKNYTPKVMQYTGLKDKNGVEIYEGDIIKVVNGSEGELNAVIEWEDYYLGYRLKRIKDGTHWHLYQWRGDDIGLEIIGNIYENPDLLN